MALSVAFSAFWAPAYAPAQTVITATPTLASPALTATEPSLPVIRSPLPAAVPAVPQAGGVQVPSDPSRALTDARADDPPPSEFQRFVFNATGRYLLTFGSRYFSASESLALPLERIPVPGDYVVGPGDELFIRAWGSVDMDVRAVVDRNGQISIPRVGTVSVANIRATELENFVRAQVSRVFRGFNLSVTLGQLRSMQIFVVGHARRPGAYTVGSLSTLVNAIFLSGGPSQGGSMRNVQLRRNNAVIIEFDLYDFIVAGDKARDVRLQPGDVLVYRPAGPRVALLGATDAPAIYELKSAGETLRDVLALSGGARATTNARRAQLERIDPTQPRAPRVVQSLDPSSASALALRDGDVITLFDVEPEFSNAVTLRGNVARALRYPHSSGMRVSDLIPERAALVTPDYHIRKNKLVQFFDVDPPAAASPEATAEQRATALLRGPRAGSSIGTERVTTERVSNDIRNIVDEPNWEYATIERLNPDKVTLALLPFNLARAIVDKDPAHDLELMPGDVVTIFSGKDIRRPQGRGTRLVRIEGEVERPGVYQLAAGDTLRGVLVRAGGFTPQAYLFGIEFSRAATRDKQRQALQEAVRRLEATLAATGIRQAANLGATDAASAARLQAAEQEARNNQLAKLRSLQPTGRIALELRPEMSKLEQLPDVPLDDGDTIVVPSRPGFVFAVGAVSNDNAILWRPGRSLKSYLAAAGVSPDADVANLFVVRADGTVQHRRDSRSGWFADDFSNLELAPGDTVVVPDLANRETVWSAFVRGAKDWTQILANFGLAAAAIKTLR